MIDLKKDIKNVDVISYHFEDENLDLEIPDPDIFEVLPDGTHVINDTEGYTFFISPKWVYFTIHCKNP